MNPNEEPKYCKCGPSSVAHVRGCYEGWGEPRETGSPQNMGEYAGQQNDHNPSSPKEVHKREDCPCPLPPCFSCEPTPEANWEEELRKACYLRPRDAEDANDIYQAILPTIRTQIRAAEERGKAFVPEGETLDIPMGVSQWKNHGDKWHYSEFWEEKIIAATRQKTIAEVRKMIEDPSHGKAIFTDAKSVHDFGKGYQQAQKDILSRLAEKEDLQKRSE